MKKPLRPKHHHLKQEQPKPQVAQLCLAADLRLLAQHKRLLV